MRLPGAALLVGLWPSEEAVLHDDRLRTAVGADYYTSSLREAVEERLDALHQAELASGAATEPAERAPTSDAAERVGSISPGQPAAASP